MRTAAVESATSSGQTTVRGWGETKGCDWRLELDSAESVMVKSSDSDLFWLSETEEVMVVVCAVGALGVMGVWIVGFNGLGIGFQRPSVPIN